MPVYRMNLVIPFLLASDMKHPEYFNERSLLEIRASLPVTATAADSEEDGVFLQPIPLTGNFFSDSHWKTIDAVQMQLFPDDGNGPSARDLNALPYLEWAMIDPVNLGDGDPSFLANGAELLNRLSYAVRGSGFAELQEDAQNELLHQLAGSKTGENWLSLLMFYLTEALALDPYYGGNPDMVGWLWLEHRPGFPRPVAGKSYRDFE